MQWKNTSVHILTVSQMKLIQMCHCPQYFPSPIGATPRVGHRQDIIAPKLKVVVSLRQLSISERKRIQVTRAV